jgi:sugar phosphate isomerase/epimerase
MRDMPITRRTVLAALAAAPAIVRAQPRGERLPISFSTLGCPKWPWTRVLEQASQMGFAAIELRGIEMKMDLPALPEFTGTRVNDSVKDLEALGLKISDLGASSRMHEGDPKVRQAQLDEGRRFIDLAQKLKTPYVRVFGDKVPPGEQKRDVMARVIEGLRTLGEHAKGSGVAVLLETHGDYTDSPTVVELMKGAAMDTVALVWDAHHTFVAGKEQPAVSFAALKPWVRHTHLKDSRPEASAASGAAPKPDGSDVRYVLTGKGTVPVREQVRLLKAAGYKGYYGFEWEKGWHPEIEEPEVAFPQFVQTIREYLKS